MPIYGIGIDLVKTERIATLIERWGERFETRVFTESEREFCLQRKDRASCLAMRFAAKEAFAKAMGLGMRSPILWLDMEVKRNELGRPNISLSVRALEYCRKAGVRSWHLSLTDDGGFAAAIVVIET